MFHSVFIPALFYTVIIINKNSVATIKRHTLSPFAISGKSFFHWWKNHFPLMEKPHTPISLRLYLLNIQSKVLILGNGGLKSTATYQENENLHRCVRTLQKIDIQLKQLEHQKILIVTGTQLLGNLQFSIDD